MTAESLDDLVARLRREALEWGPNSATGPLEFDAADAIVALRARAESAEKALDDARKYRKAFLDVDCEGILEKDAESGYRYVPVCRLLRAEVVALREALDSLIRCFRSWTGQCPPGMREVVDAAARLAEKDKGG